MKDTIAYAIVAVVCLAFFGCTINVRLIHEPKPEPQCDNTLPRLIPMPHRIDTTWYIQNTPLEWHHDTTGGNYDVR